MTINNNDSVLIKIKRVSETAMLPVCQTAGSAGFDVYADLQKPLIIKPMQRAQISTGIACEIPSGYELQIRPRSGLALKYGITLIGSPATIDSDFRGEISVVLINLGNQDFMVVPKMRVAQLILQKLPLVAIKEVDSLSVTDRNTNGFGSTGLF